MELHAHKPWVLRQLHDFRQVFGRRPRTDDHTGFFEPRHINIVDFVAVAVTLIDFCTVDGLGTGAWLHRTTLGPLTHGAAQIGIRITALNLAFAVLPFGN